MKKVFKAIIEPKPNLVQTISGQLVRGAVPVHVAATVDNKIAVWYEVDEGREGNYSIFVVPVYTGDPVPSNYFHCGTVILKNWIVVHLYLMDKVL